MNNKSIFANPNFLTFSSLFTEVIALFIIYIQFIDEFLHSILFIFLYLAMFVFAFLIASSFKSGKKELMKSAVAALFTICFVFHAMAFTDMINLNYYYLFTGNIVFTCIALIAMLLFVLFVFAFAKHFAINSSNESKTKDVKFNKILLLIIGILGLVQAGLISYKDYTSGRVFELYLILSYVMFFFISLMLISIETLVNEFRLAREKGELTTFATNLVGKKAADVAAGKAPAKKATAKKTTKKTTKKTK